MRKEVGRKRERERERDRERKRVAIRKAIQYVRPKLK